MHGFGMMNQQPMEIEDISMDFFKTKLFADYCGKIPAGKLKMSRRRVGSGKLKTSAKLACFVLLRSYNINA